MTPGSATGRPDARAARVAFRGTAAEWRLEIEDLRAVEARVGRRILLVVFKVFHGIDRIMSLEQLLGFNARELEADSPGYDRNLHLLIMQLVGAMHELGGALQELCNAQAALVVGRDSESWARLNAWRKRLRGDPKISDLRAQVSAHLGDLEIYEAGLEELLTEADPGLVLVRADGHLRHAGFATGAWDCLYRGLGFETDEFADVLKFVRDAHHELPSAFTDFLTELFAASDVEIVNEIRGAKRPGMLSYALEIADRMVRRCARKIRRLATAVETRPRIPS